LPTTLSETKRVIFLGNDFRFFMQNNAVSNPTIWQALDDWARKLKAWQRQILSFATQNGHGGASGWECDREAIKL
jgi:hypothetical protein